MNNLMKELFKQLIVDFHKEWEVSVKKRKLEVPLNIDKIITIIWPRRAGKSYYLFWLIKKLINEWFDKERIVYINFEDERINIEGFQLQLLLDAYLELYPQIDLKSVYFFFDEIQNITGWEKFIRRIYDSGIRNIFITWSNSKLLSREIASNLRGRSISYELLPLSFDEFIYFKWEEDLNFYSTKDKAKLLNYQKEFLFWGGFPEIVFYNEEIKLKVLQEYFEVMLYNDLIERYNIKNFVVLKEFVKQLIQSATKEYSINKIWNYLKSRWLKFDKNDLYTFVEYLQNVYFFKSVSKYWYSLRNQVAKKVYLFDNGYLNALSFKFSNDFWKLLENAVFVELYRRFGDNLYFWKNWWEVDFVVENRWDKLLFQVSYKLTDENLSRELKWCLSWMKYFWLDKCFLITFEEKDTIKVDDKIVQILPFYVLIYGKNEVYWKVI